MQALWFDGKLELRDVPAPQPKRGEAIIRVTLAGICGTDREILKGYSNFRGIPGHEFVGRVEECADHAWVGRRVVGEINITCGQCSRCKSGLGRHCPTRTVMGIVNREGAFAEYVALPVVNLHAVPDSVPDDAAVFVEPLAAAAEVLDAVKISPPPRTVLLGDGRLALLIAQVMHNAGADVTVIGRHASKLEQARQIGVKTLDAAMEKLPAASIPLIIDATGSPDGFAEALRLVEPRGTVVMKSTFHDLARFDTAKLVVDEIRLVGSRRGNFSTALDLLESGKIKVRQLVSKTFPLASWREAFEFLKKETCLKVLLAPRHGISHQPPNPRFAG